MRNLFALFLSLVLAVGSVSMAVAHGQTPMGDSVTICTTDGTQTVTLDRNGNPVSTSPHLCPDCLSAASAFTLLDDAQLPSRPQSARLAKVHVTTLTLPSLPAPAAQARGPPALFV